VPAARAAPAFDAWENYFTTRRELFRELNGNDYDAKWSRATPAGLRGHLSLSHLALQWRI